MSSNAIKTSKWGAPIALAPIIVCYSAAMIVPIVGFLSLAFMKYSPMELYTLEATFENFSRLLSDPYYRASILQTFRISALVTVFSLLLGYLLAFYLAGLNGIARGILMFLIVAPLMTGVIVRTYGWIVVLGTDGLINTLLLSTRMVDAPLQLMNRESAVVVALVHIMLPYMVFPIFSSLASQDPDLARAAGTLGANPLQTFLEVTLPLSKSGIVMGCALVFTLSAGTVVTPQLLGGNDTMMMGQTIYQLVLSVFNWPLGAAVALLLMAVQFLVISVYFKGATNGDR